MQVPVSDADGKLIDLVRRAEAGDDVVLTRHGQPTVRLVLITPTQRSAEIRARRRALLEAFRGSGLGKFDTNAARSQDFLYDEDGLPA